MFRKKDDMRGFELCTEPAGYAGKKEGRLFAGMMPEDSGENGGRIPEKQNIPDKQEDEIISSRMATKKKQRKKEIISWIISLSAAVIFALFLRFFVFR
jgi:hypothetical protein